MLVLCWPKLSLCCPMLTLCWPKLPLSCPYIDPMFAYVGRGNALPHSSDRNDGGDDGLGRGWGGGHPKLGRRLGRHASITFGYHRRPPARTRGLWPAPGFKGYRPCRRPLNLNYCRATHFNQTPEKNKNEFWNCYLAMLGRVARSIKSAI